MERYYVICDDDDHIDVHVFATHGWFLTPESAAEYAATVAPDRRPAVVRQHSEFYQRYQSAHVYITDNRFGIPVGYYNKGGLVRLLREHSAHPAAVYFITEMME